MPRRFASPKILAWLLPGLLLLLGSGLGFWLAGAERRTFEAWQRQLPAAPGEASQSLFLQLARLELALGAPQPDWTALAPQLTAWLAQPDLPPSLSARARYDLSGVHSALADLAPTPEERLRLLTLAQAGYQDLLAYPELEPELARLGRGRLAWVRAQLYELTRLLGDPDYRRLMGLSPDQLAQELERLQDQWATLPNPRTGQLRDWALEILERKLKSFPPFLPLSEPSP